MCIKEIFNDDPYEQTVEQPDEIMNNITNVMTTSYGYDVNATSQMPYAYNAYNGNPYGNGNGNQMYGNQMYGNQTYGNQMYGNGNQMYGNGNQQN